MESERENLTALLCFVIIMHKWIVYKTCKIATLKACFGHLFLQYDTYIDNIYSCTTYTAVYVLQHSCNTNKSQSFRITNC